MTPEGSLSLTDSQYHYVVHVLRLSVEDTLELVSEDGLQAIATLTTIERDYAIVTWQQAVTVQHALPLTLMVAIPKGDRADWMIEKLAEIGVQRIVLTEFERSVVTPHASGNKMQRWIRLAQAASQQSKRTILPEIVGPLPLAESMRLVQSTTHKYVADFQGLPLTTMLHQHTSESCVLAVGPEGGISDQELAQFDQAGYHRVVLAPYVLRIETAAIAGASVMGCWQCHLHLDHALFALTAKQKT